MPGDRRVEVLSDMLAGHAARILGIPGEAVDWHTPLPELGLDSLMAVELRARLSIALDVDISALELTRTGGLAALAERLSEQVAIAK
jgi:acyl carrier protein